MDANNNTTTKYRRESLDSETDNSLSIEQEPQALSNSFKYYLFGLTAAIYLIYGCQNSLLGPTLQDLTKLLHTGEENMAIILSVKCLVIIVSTSVVSLSFEKIGHRQFQFVAAVIIFSVLGGMTPYFTSFPQFLCASVFSGFVTAFIEAVVNLTVLELFSSNSKVYMQLMHICFTIGTIFGPALSGPFLSEKPKENNETIELSTTPMPSASLSESFSNLFIASKDGQPEAFETHIQVPYLIVSFLLILVAVWLMISQIRRPYVPEKRKLAAKQKKVVEKPMEDYNLQNGKVSPGFTDVLPEPPAGNTQVENVTEKIEMPTIFYVLFLGVVGVLFAFYMCMEGLIGIFLPTFLEKKMNFTGGQASYMSSVVFVSMAVGRVFTIVFSMRITCKFMLFFNFSITLAGFFMLTFFAVNSRPIVWLSCILIGCGLSSTYPIIISYVENRIVITNNVQLYLLLSSLVLLVFVPIVIGYYIATAPMLFAYVNLSMAVAALGLMFAMHFIDIYKRRLIREIKSKKGDLAVSEEPLDYNI